jgi:hypothetical protein
LNEAPVKGSDLDDTGFHTAEDLNKSTSTAVEIPTETNDANVVKPSGSVLHFHLCFFFVLVTFCFSVLDVAFVTFIGKSMIWMVVVK